MDITNEQLRQIIKEELDAVLAEKEGKKDACYHKVKARYDVWPSAYASGALVKCRKVGAKNWGNSKKDEGLALDEEVTPEEEEDLKKASKELSKASEMHKNQSDRIKKALDEKKKSGLTSINEVSTVTIRRGSHKRRIVLEEKRINERCQKGYKTHDTQKTKEMFGKTYRNCVKAEEGLEIEEEKKKAGTESSKESSLRDWFGRKGAKGKKKGWVDCNAPDGKGGYKSCGRSDGEKRSKYPSCRPTPGACKEKGKGKSWGKKAAKGKKK